MDSFGNEKRLVRPVSMCSKLLTILIMTIALFFTFGAFGILFSGATSIGPEVHDYLMQYGEYWKPISSAGFAILLILYIFDARYWENWTRILYYAFFSIGILILLLGVVLSAEVYPVAPPAVFMLIMPAVLYAVKKLAIDSCLFVSTGIFLKLMFFPFLLCSIAIVWFWITWVFVLDNWWDVDLRNEYKLLMKCDMAEEYCLSAYLLWISPFIAGIAGVFFGFFAFLLGSTIDDESGRSTQKLMRTFVFMVIVLMLGVWIGASIAGAQTGMASMVEMFAGAGFLIVGALIAKTVGVEKLSREASRVPMLAKMQNVIRSSDWIKAMLVVCFSIPYVIFLLISCINQLCRCCCSCFRPEPMEWEDQRTFWVTHHTYNQLQTIKNWKWTSVLSKVCLIGVIYAVVVVGVGQLTTIFLSWFIAQLDGVNIAVVYVIFIAVGLCMFLLPPVPGVPVYLTGGIVITQASSDALGFWGGVAMAATMAWVCKMLVLPMQQIGIGELMGSRVSIRKLVGVNSISMRAIKMILSKPGLAFDKVCILVGGPDWPTSVTTGILKLSRIQMIIGTLPVVFLVAPTAAAGAFMLKKAEGGIWDSVATCTLAVAALVQGMALIAALYFIEKVADANKEKLENMPPDKEVLKCEKADEAKQKLFDECTDWHNSGLSIIIKICLILSAFFMAVACYILQFMDCFEPFQITDSISVTLDGKVLNIVLLQGWAALASFAVAIFFYFIFKLYAGCRTRGKVPPETVGSELDEIESDKIEIQSDSD